MDIGADSQAPMTIAAWRERRSDADKLRADLDALESKLATVEPGAPETAPGAGQPEAAAQRTDMAVTVLASLAALAALVLLVLLALGVWALAKPVQGVAAAVPTALTSLREINTNMGKLAAVTWSPAGGAPSEALATPTATPSPKATATPTHTPVPPMATPASPQGGVLKVILTPGDRAKQVTLAWQTCKNADCKEPTPQTLPAMSQDGAYALPLPPGDTLFHRIIVTPTQGVFVAASPTPEGWTVSTDGVTGFLVSATRASALKADAGGVHTLTLAMGSVPILSGSPVPGTVTVDPIRTAPFYDNQTSSSAKRPTGQVDVLGEWSVGSDKARLGRVPSSPKGVAEYFWGRYGRTDNTWVISLTNATDAEKLPTLHLPDGFTGVKTVPPGWTATFTNPVDGLAVLEVMEATVQPLTWTLGTITGWVTLEAWAVKGSVAVTYTILADGQQIEPVAGKRSVDARDENTLSGFVGIGTYHVAKPMKLTVTLTPPQTGTVRALMLRVIRDKK